MDEIDITAGRLDAEMEQLLALRRASGPAATGQCLWCGEPLRQPLRWCNAGCRDDWERANERRG